MAVPILLIITLIKVQQLMDAIAFPLLMQPKAVGNRVLVALSLVLGWAWTAGPNQRN
jgi:predicted PurR-regulated permease PerM